MPQLHRRIVIEVEANVSAVNNHEQNGDLERRFVEEQLVQPVKDALQVFHRSPLSEVVIRTDVFPI